MAESLESVASSMKTMAVQSLEEITNPFEWHKISIPCLDALTPRVGHALVPLKNGNILIIGGSNHEGALPELWEVNLRSYYKGKENEGGDGLNEKGPDCDSPTLKEHLNTQEAFRGRYEFLCAKERQSGKNDDTIWIFGGADLSNSMNDVAYIQGGHFIESVSDSKDAPSPRTQGSNSAIVEIEDKSYLAVFAGGLKGTHAVADGNLYLYNIEEQNWKTISVKSDTPPLTQGHAMTAFGSKIFVHGGMNEMTLHETLYMIDLKDALGAVSKPISWILIETENHPPGRAAHGMARSLEAGKECFYIFGGLGEQGALNDLWRFDLESLVWTELANPKEVDGGLHPCPRFDFAMTVVQIKGKHAQTRSDENGDSIKYILVHGGLSAQGELFNDLWAMKIE